VIAGALGLIWVGLFVTQVLQGYTFRHQAERNRTRLIHLPAARGSILDRNGLPLAEDRLSFELIIFPQELKDPEVTWSRLSDLLQVPSDELKRRYRRGYQAPFSPVRIARDLPSALAFQLEEERYDLPGIFIRPAPQRHYPLGSAVGSVAGYLGLLDPQELTRLKPYGYTVRDRIGKDGLEQFHDRTLRGQDGGLHVEVNARGKLVRQLGARLPEQGQSITVSLDSRLQERYHRLLKKQAGAIAVMDADSGEILALVSAPSVDPNAFGDPDRQKEVSRFLIDPARPMFNRVTQSSIPPGSTFKAAVSYYGLADQKIATDTYFTCPGFLKLGRARFRCWKEGGHDAQNVVEAMMHSCNVFFYETGRRLGVEGLVQAARLFRLGQRTGIDLPQESAGLVPDADWMRKRHEQRWQEGDTVSFAVGQGALLVSPLQMLMLYNAVAKNGLLPQPHLLLAERRSSKGIQRIPLKPKALEPVRLGLQQVVASGSGTGRLAGVRGVSVSGKTGTAQVSRGRSHAWFCGFAPSGDPKVTFVVFLEHGGKGGLQAARVAKEVVQVLKTLEYL